ncbi:hypothetical protein QBC35DRAFT_488672 [Podospora australis]|uniref:Uncharacterized protein n=1 Tax=Podospora australis TaxID=1536484 RepID=A0AAN6X3Y7_9PEZI|nr:hypothetical protein QBC35DRAFT_488672 [Podospora australis]
MSQPNQHDQDIEDDYLHYTINLDHFNSPQTSNTNTRHATYLDEGGTRARSNHSDLLRSGSFRSTNSALPPQSSSSYGTVLQPHFGPAFRGVNIGGFSPNSGRTYHDNNNIGLLQRELFPSGPPQHNWPSSLTLFTPPKPPTPLLQPTPAPNSDTVHIRIENRYNTRAQTSASEDCFISISVVRHLGLDVTPIPVTWIKSFLIRGLGMVTPTAYCTFSCDIEWLRLRLEMNVMVVEEWQLPNATADEQPPISLYLGRRFLHRHSHRIEADVTSSVDNQTPPAQSSTTYHHTQLAPSHNLVISRPDPTVPATNGFSGMPFGSQQHLAQPTRYGNLHEEMPISGFAHLRVPEPATRYASRSSPCASSASRAATINSNIFSGQATGPSSTSNQDPGELTFTNANSAWYSPTSGSIFGGSRFGGSSVCGCGSECACNSSRYQQH